MKLKTVLGEDELVIHKLTGHEAVSKPFEFHVRMLSENREVVLKSLLRTKAVISLALPDGTSRYINGQWRQLK